MGGGAVCCKLRRGSPQAEEGNATAEGTWEKVRVCRRGKVPLLGRVRGGGADCHGFFPNPSGCLHRPTLVLFLELTFRA